MMRLFAFGLIIFSIAVYATDPVKGVPELIITIFGVAVGIYYAFIRKLDGVMP